MTERQRLYIANRAAGLGQERAALAAGYAKSSAAVVASRLEKKPEIRAAIDEARKAAQPSLDAPQEFADPECYLLAVVRGQMPPDPVRVGAARALLPYLNARKRAPVKSATPKQLQTSEVRSEDQEARNAWAARAAEVRARLKRTA